MVGDLDFSTLIIVFFTLVISITLHEAMHAYTGYFLGDDTAKAAGRISLNPLKHVDPFATILLPLITLVIFNFPFLAAKPVPFNPYRVKFAEFGAALIGISGPLTNLFLAIMSAGMIRLIGDGVSEGLLNVMGIFLIVNIGLFVFNMIPIPPLDGSRLLYAFAPESFQKFMASLEQFGIFIVFALVLAVPTFVDLLVRLNQSIVNFLL